MNQCEISQRISGMTNDPELDVLFNGSCPICRAEIAHYADHAKDHDIAIRWIDVSDPNERGNCHGLDADRSLRRLHAAGPDGPLLEGVDAFIAVWQRLPRWRGLAWLCAMPLVRPLAHFLYEHVAARTLYHWNKRRSKTRLMQH